VASFHITGTVLVFNWLSHDSILHVVDLRIRDVAARLGQRRIKLDVDDAARAWLAKKGLSDVYGARAIVRIVRSEVLFPLARRMLTGTIIHDGDIVEIRVGMTVSFPRSGPSVLLYSGLPLSSPVVIERSFMCNTFQVTSANHQSSKCRYIFSMDDPVMRHNWTVSLKHQIDIGDRVGRIPRTTRNTDTTSIGEK
jgi:hypothetical protein